MKKKNHNFDNVSNYILVRFKILYILLWDIVGETYKTMYDVHSRFQVYHAYSMFCCGMSTLMGLTIFSSIFLELTNFILVHLIKCGFFFFFPYGLWPKHLTNKLVLQMIYFSKTTKVLRGEHFGYYFILIN